MLNNLSYKQKLKLLGGAALLLLLICYRFAVSNTIDEYRACRRQLDNNQLLESSRQASPGLVSKGALVSGILQSYLLDTLDNSRNLLSVASAWCTKNNVELKEYKPLGIHDYDSLSIMMRLLTVEGSFIDCLRLNYLLETQSRCGRIGSVLYKSYTDPKDKSVHLNCSFYLLNITSYETAK